MNFRPSKAIFLLIQLLEINWVRSSLWFYLFIVEWRVNSLLPWNIMTYHRAPEIAHIPPCSQKSSVGDRAPHIRACFAKKRKLFFGMRFCGVWMLDGAWGIQEFHCIFAVLSWNHVYHRLRTCFWLKIQKKSVVMWGCQLENGLMLRNILGLQPWTLHYLLLCTCAWWKRSKRAFLNPRIYKYRSCSTRYNATVLHQGGIARYFLGNLCWCLFWTHGIDVSGENEMAHTVDLNFHQTTLESLENSFAIIIWAEAWSAFSKDWKSLLVRFIVCTRLRPGIPLSNNSWPSTLCLLAQIVHGEIEIFGIVCSPWIG